MIRHELWIVPVPEGMTPEEAYDEIRLYGELLPEHVVDDELAVQWAVFTHAVTVDDEEPSPRGTGRPSYMTLVDVLIVVLIVAVIIAIIR